MTDDLTARVRIFTPDDLAVPDGWPEDVGIAVLQIGGAPEIFPVHRQEDPARILARIESLTSHDLARAEVFPPVEGHAVCNLPFTGVARLRAEVESFLSRTPAAVEEAADFSVNFGFAADEGLDLSTLVQGVAPKADKVARPAPPTGCELPGYASFDPAHPPCSDSISALLWQAPSGELVILTDGTADPVKLDPTEVLVRDDGLGLALRRRNPALDAGWPGYVLLPSGCLGIAVPAGGTHVLVMPRTKHFLVTPVMDWRPVAGSEPAPDAEFSAPAHQSAAVSVDNRLFGAAFAFIAAAALAVVVVNSNPTQVAESVGTFQQLRAQLFQ